MVDVHDKATRSRNMSAIKSSNTTPEVQIRKALFAKGYRFRKHVRTLPGSPDLVLPKYKTCIFIHGCFWHMHANCSLFELPKSRKEFWSKKLNENKARDLRHQEELVNLGWQIIIVWECATKGSNKLALDEVTNRISQLLEVAPEENCVLEIR